MEHGKQFQDIPRSENLVMRLGDATLAERATILAKTLDKLKFLDATYTPPTLQLARKMQAKREAGRALLTGENKVQTRRPDESKLEEAAKLKSLI